MDLARRVVRRFLAETAATFDEDEYEFHSTEFPLKPNGELEGHVVATKNGGEKVHGTIKLKIYPEDLHELEADLKNASLTWHDVQAKGWVVEPHGYAPAGQKHVPIRRCAVEVTFDHKGKSVLGQEVAVLADGTFSY
jgi:hypothetical protein